MFDFIMLFLDYISLEWAFRDGFSENFKGYCLKFLFHNFPQSINHGGFELRKSVFFSRSKAQ